MYTNIEAELVRAQLTKEEISKKLGITSKTYLGYVRGSRPIPSDVLLSLSRMFGCKVDYLLGVSPADESA